MADDDRLQVELTGAHAEVLDLQARLAKATARRAELAVDLHAAGWSMQRIADALGLSKNAVAKMIRITR